ncbi:CPBP family intramembrane glutamic endopeptidase [Neisseriaceae bacterium B1]
MKNYRNYLSLIDFFILATLLFGSAIYSSTIQYLELLSNNQIVPTNLEFDNTGNWSGIGMELTLLLLTFGYLYYRKFNFKRLNFNINAKTGLKILLYILLAGSVASAYEVLQQMLFPEFYPATDQTEVYNAAKHFAMWSPSFIVFAFVNGFFEELFFIGLVPLVQRKHLPLVIVLSLLVRFAFHTYQGLAGALTITTLGIVFLLLRRKSNELLPFTFAHTFFDLFGLGLPFYLLG